MITCDFIAMVIFAKIQIESICIIEMYRYVYILPTKAFIVCVSSVCSVVCPNYMYVALENTILCSSKEDYSNLIDTKCTTDSY